MIKSIALQRNSSDFLKGKGKLYDAFTICVYHVYYHEDDDDDDDRQLRVLSLSWNRIAGGSQGEYKVLKPNQADTVKDRGIKDTRVISLPSVYRLYHVYIHAHIHPEDAMVNECYPAYLITVISPFTSLAISMILLKHLSHRPRRPSHDSYTGRDPNDFNRHAKTSRLRKIYLFTRTGFSFYD